MEANDLANIEGVYAEVPEELISRFDDAAVVECFGPKTLIPAGKQYRVQEGDVIYIEKLNAEVEASVKFDVLMCGEGDSVKIGTPVVEGASVEGKVLAQDKSKKVVVFKYKSKKNYRKTTGHRQPYTKVEIQKISQ